MKKENTTKKNATTKRNATTKAIKSALIQATIADHQYCIAKNVYRNEKIIKFQKDETPVKVMLRGKDDAWHILSNVKVHKSQEVHERKDKTEWNGKVTAAQLDEFLKEFSFGQ